MPHALDGHELALAVLPQMVNGGIGQHAAAQLQVTIAAWPGMSEGDLLELFWEGRYVASSQVRRADVGQPLSLRVPESFVHNGHAHVHYQVLKVGSAPWRSSLVEVLVKLDCPGGLWNQHGCEENQFLPPLVVPAQVLQTGVTAGHAKRGLTLILEPYRHMAAMDAITLQWGDVRIDLPTLLDTQVGKPLKAKIPGSVILESGPDDRLEVTWCVIDRVGNHSGWAPARTVPSLVPCGA